MISVLKALSTLIGALKRAPKDSGISSYLQKKTNTKFDFKL